MKVSVKGSAIPRPDYTEWDLINEFGPTLAAHLWLGLEPENDVIYSVSSKVGALAKRIMAETGASESNYEKKQTVTRAELLELAEKLMVEPPFLFPDKRTEQAAVERDLSQSTYWRELERKTRKAIKDYPQWRAKQTSVKKEGNLQNWLTGDILADSREAHIIKKTLSDIFEDLR